MGITIDTIKGEWSLDDLTAVKQAVALVGEKILTTPARRSTGNSPLTAFKRVYGLHDQQTLKLSWNIDCPMCKPAYCRKEGNANEKDYSVDDPNIKIPLIDGTKVACDCKPKGGFTQDEHWIEFASLWPNFTSSGTYWQSVRKTNNIIHELGHAFNQRAGQAPQNSVADYSEYLAVDGKTELFKMNSRPNGFYTIGPGTMTWVQSDQVNGSEVFADMFIGWIYDKWASDPYGDARARFMNKDMPSWVASAIRRP